MKHIHFIAKKYAFSCTESFVLFHPSDAYKSVHFSYFCSLQHRYCAAKTRIPLYIILRMII